MRSAPLLTLPLLLLAACASGPAPSATAPTPRSHAYVAGETPPPQTGRPAGLVPGALPRRVRYHFADDATVTRLADRLQAGLTAGDPKLFGDLVLVQPGAWSHLQAHITLSLADAASLSMMDPSQDIKAQIQGGGGLQGRMFRSPHAMLRLAEEMKRLLDADGGFTVRALSTDEMAKWWIYIAFDIEEPVYVVATSSGKYRFIVTFNQDKVFSIDELNGLPGPG